MRFVRDKMIDRLIVINKGKRTTKVKDLRKRKNQTTTEIERTESRLLVKSKNKKYYEIIKLSDKCCCQMVCDECKTCIHQFYCS